MLRLRTGPGQHAWFPYRVGQNRHASYPSCSIKKDRQSISEVICIRVLYSAPSTYVDSYMYNCCTRLTKLSIQAWNASSRLSSLTESNYRFHCAGLRFDLVSAVKDVVKRWENEAHQVANTKLLSCWLCLAFGALFCVHL